MNIDNFDDANTKWCVYQDEERCDECIWCDTEEEAQEINNEMFGGKGFVIFYDLEEECYYNK